MRDNITLKQMEELWSAIDKLTTIGEWKRKVKEFAKKHQLTDMEAIEIANLKASK